MKKKSQIKIILLLLFLFGWSEVWGQVYTVSPTFVDGGSVANGANVWANITIKAIENDLTFTEPPYTIGNYVINGGDYWFLYPGYQYNKILKGNSGNVVFAATAKGGVRSDPEDVISTAIIPLDYGIATVTLKFTQSGDIASIPSIVRNTQVSFTGVTQRTLYILNVGNSNLIISKLALQGVAFSCTNPLISPNTTINTNIIIPPRQNYELPIKFTPSGSGLLTGQLSITSNHVDKSYIHTTSLAGLPGGQAIEILIPNIPKKLPKIQLIMGDK